MKTIEDLKDARISTKIIIKALDIAPIVLYVEEGYSLMTVHLTSGLNVNLYNLHKIISDTFVSEGVDMDMCLNGNTLKIKWCTAHDKLIPLVGIGGL